MGFIPLLSRQVSQIACDNAAPAQENMPVVRVRTLRLSAIDLLSRPAPLLQPLNEGSSHAPLIGPMEQESQISRCPDCDRGVPVERAVLRAVPASTDSPSQDRDDRHGNPPPAKNPAYFKPKTSHHVPLRAAGCETPHREAVDNERACQAPKG
jgi:hypothetical protein